MIDIDNYDRVIESVFPRAPDSHNNSSSSSEIGLGLLIVIPKPLAFSLQSRESFADVSIGGAE